MKSVVQNTKANTIVDSCHQLVTEDSYAQLFETISFNRKLIVNEIFFLKHCKLILQIIAKSYQ